MRSKLPSPAWPALRSKLRGAAPEIAWGVFAYANLTVMFMLDHWQTVPFHFIWVSLTILYGFRRWGAFQTAVVLLAVMIGTGTALGQAAVAHGHGIDELTEVPLMAAMFVAMVWHARRRQVAVDALARASQREREFARDASHELRTPITIARGHAELIRSAVAGREEEADVDVILDELDRLATISARLLAIAAAEQPGALDLRPIDIEALITETADRWSATVVRCWTSDVHVRGTLVADGGRIASALDALVENAVAATSAGDPISLSCRAVGHDVHIEVRDGGRGIESDDLDRVFERFARIVPAAGAAAEGAGLGLAIVKAIVEAHGGQVSVTSRPGDGSAFVLSLPGFRPAAHAFA